MIFNFVLSNHPQERLKKMPDLLRPLQHGLAEAGHHVIGYGLGLLPAPAVNVLVEFFPDDDFVDTLVKMKSTSGKTIVLGLVCAEDLEDDEGMELSQYPRRGANLQRVLRIADFVWTLVPQVAVYEAICGPGRVALLDLGFSERLLNAGLITAPGLRDIDVVLDGEETPRRREIVAGLRGRGLKCFVSGTSPLPSFATTDLARRAKLLLDARRSPAARYSSPRRLCKGLHNGVLVVTETTGPGAGGSLDRYSLCCEPAAVVERCVATIRSGLAIELGLAALASFRAETSLRENMRRALQSPLFDRLAR